MGLRTMDWSEWIELDNHYLRFHGDKKRRIAERGQKCYRTANEPQVFDGAVELLEELCGYLPQRYPSMFKKTEVGMDNVVTNESFDIRKDVLTCNGNKEDPMCMAARMTQDDLAIMFERDDGQYYLLAGAILLAGFWRLEDKLGMPLSEIHTRFVQERFIIKKDSSPQHARLLTTQKPTQRGCARIQREAREGHDELLPPRQARRSRPTKQLLHPSRR